jgi:aspartate racemase
MKTIGLLGGMSDQATVEYYRMINAAVNRRLGGWEIAEMVIIGVNFGNIEQYVRQGDWQAAGAYLATKAAAAQAAGADFLMCGSNTMHRVADQFMAGLQIPFLHIAEPTGQAIVAAGLKRVALLGTKPVMGSPSMRNYYEQHFGFEVIVPTEDEQIAIDRIIFDELVRHDLRSASKEYYLAVCDRLREAGAEGVILGCTEIFLLINQADRPDFPMFDTTTLHVAAAVEWALA